MINNNPNATLEEMLRKLKSVKEHSYVELTKLNGKTYSVRIGYSRFLEVLEKEKKVEHEWEAFKIVELSESDKNFFRDLSDEINNFLIEVK